jgi:hypothetical protein
MALSLNDGSYGLLMDPLNGVADLEARLLRLVSNYGFLEDPIRLVRAVRLQTRLGWELEEKTKTRFDNARQEGMIGQVSAHQLGYEIEEIVHEEDGLKILKALEADGWMKALFPAWTSAKVDVQALESLREVLVQLQMQGVNPDPSAAQAELLTAKLPPKDLAALKKLFVRQGFVHEWETQEERAKEFGKRLTSKEAALPSAAWKLLTSADPEAVLWLALTSKSGPVQAKFKDFFTVWPEARQRIPYTLMQEMRITPELEGYQELLKSIFFELIDGKLTTDEEIRAFLEPHSPPAPPPPVSIRRTRAKRSSEKSRARESEDDEPSEARSAHGDEDGDEELDLDEEGDSGDERPELIARTLPPIVPPLPPPPVAAIEETRLPAPMLEKAAEEKVAEEVEPAPAPVKSAPKRVEPAGKAEVKAEGKAEVVKPAVKAVAAKTPVKSASKPVPAKTAAKTAPKPTGKVPAKAAVKSKPVAKPAPPAKAGVKKAVVKPVKGGKTSAKPKSVKVVAKAKPAVSKPKPAPALKKAAKVVAKTAVKSQSAKATAVKTAAKKAPAKKRR